LGILQFGAVLSDSTATRGLVPPPNRSTEQLMHIPDGFLSTPVCLATGAISIAAVGYSVYRLKHSLADRTIPLAGMVSALVFTGQMVNFPVLMGTSGHLVGGVLAARLVGPWAGCLSLTLVLFVQRFLFADGGLLALGANVFHMAVVGAMGGYAIQAVVTRLLGRTTRASVIGTVVASWITVMLAAFLCCLEFALSRDSLRGFDLGRFLVLMILFHAFIGIGESLISGGIIRMVSFRRPDLLYQSEPSRVTRPGFPTAQGLLIALLVTICLAPLASSLPDGLDSAIQQSVSVRPEVDSPSLFGSYEGIFGETTWHVWSVILSGLIGTLVVFAIAVILGRPYSGSDDTTPGDPSD
jgi:cobalt/nickel transport system permease protein